MTTSRGVRHGLRGRVALVAGASGGIGLAIVMLLAASGGRVVAVGRNAARIDAVTREADANGFAVEPVVCDLTDEAAVGALVDGIAARHGRLDVLVHAAGEIEFGRIDETPADELHRMVATNLRAPYVLTRAALQLLRASQGDVVFVNSSAAVRPTPGVAAYGVAKHGLRGLTDALRDDVNPDGIRVTSIYAGRTRTAMLDRVHEWEGPDRVPDHPMEPDDIAALVAAVLLLPRRAEVTDLHVRPTRPPGRPPAR